MTSIRHWIALDEAFCRLLPRPVTLRARERFAQRAAALTDIYVMKILKSVAAPPADETSLARHLRALQLTHHALTDVLTREWNTADDQFLPSQIERKVEAD